MKILFNLFGLLIVSSCSNFNRDVVIDPDAVLYNYDGDTITVDCRLVHGFVCKDNKLRVRVRNVDTPEIKGKCIEEKSLAQDAKLFTKNALFSSKEIILVVNELELYDKYKRLLADIYTDGQSLSAGLIKSGLGQEYHGGYRDPSKWCNQ
jgi:endonuclease YncB( thermonuclease family)